MKIRIMGQTISSKEFLVPFAIILLVIICIWAVKLAERLFRDDADIKLGKFFLIVLSKLPENDLNSAILNGKILDRYKHRDKDVRRIIKAIIRFGEENFTSEGKELLKGDPLKFRVNDKLRQYKKVRLSQEWE